MNDSTKCSEGLLVISSRSSLPSAELDKLRRTIEPLADEMGLRPLALCDGLEVSLVVDYTPLLTRLCAAVEALVAQGEPPQGLGNSDVESAPQALNARPTGLNSREPIGTHHGCDFPSIPKDGTFILEKGERISHEREHAALGKAIAALNAGALSGDVQIAPGASLSSPRSAPRG